jgi:DNA-binding response OmpR family regulator
MKTILIAENDNALSSLLKNHLESKNYRCFTVARVDLLFDDLEQNQYDLVILDRMLDDGDSIDALEYLADEAFQTKVLILSQKSATEERIKGLEKGADDYLSKPFSLPELTLKTKKLLSTQKILEKDMLQLGKVVIYPDSGELIIDGVQKTMRKKEMKILACLLRYKNQVVSRDKIIDLVWSGSYNIPTHSTLDVYIRRIRITLGKYKKIIKTVRGFGYMAQE